MVPLQSKPTVCGLKDPFGLTCRGCMGAPFFPYFKESQDNLGQGKCQGKICSYDLQYALIVMCSINLEC